MIARWRMARAWAALVVLVSCHACAPTMSETVGGFERSTHAPTPRLETRERSIAGPGDAFMRAPPDCVVLLPVVSRVRPAMRAQDVEVAVERFLAVRFDRVIAGPRRDRLLRHLALDAGRPDDLRIFANHVGCQHAMTVRLDGGGLSYAIVWAERRVTLSLSLARIGSQTPVLWEATATGARGDGGLPISPLGLASALFRAGRVADDAGQGRSLLDDLLRRMMASLPDVRGLSQSASGFSRRTRF